MAYLSGIVDFLKKNRIVLVSVLVFALALCSVFAFAGNKSDEVCDESVSAQESVEESLQIEENSVPEDGNLYGNGVYIDGCFVAAVASSCFCCRK